MNRHVDGAQWETVFHLPVGEHGYSDVFPSTPICQVGPLTEKFLAKYAKELAGPEWPLNEPLPADAVGRDKS